MENFNVTKNGFVISTDKLKLDVGTIHRYLCEESYWAKNIPKEVVEKSIAGSVCFGMYCREEQIGFARVITDLATFGYLADVFIVEKFRGQGLSKWLMETILIHPGLQDFRRWMLATKDAHGLYEKFGFKALENPGRFMRYSTFDVYPEK